MDTRPASAVGGSLDGAAAAGPCAGRNMGIRMSQKEILGILYTDTTVPAAAETVLTMAAEHRSRYVVTPNPEISEQCRRNPALLRAVREADLAIPDGIGVVIASRILGDPLGGRVGGFDVAMALFPLLDARGMSLYLLGAKPGVADEAAEKIHRKYPGIRLAGTCHGYFQHDAEVLGAINAARPDVLFVALGSPRQELWMHDNRESLDVGVMVGLGGSLDILSGRAKRAPRFFIDHHLEWFYRLMKQPSRFIRMLALPRYILRACRARLRGRKKDRPAAL